MKKIVVIPTYNEREAITPILLEVMEKYPEIHIIVVDDNSPDKTADIVSALAKKHSQLSLISRPGKQGLGAAYKDVLGRIKKMPDVEAVVTMDADGSHDPSYIQALLRALMSADASVGSRYVRGGGVVGWSFGRLLLSFGGNLYVNIITGIPVRDSTAGFVAFRKSTLDAVDLDAIPSTGYAYQIEFKNAVLEAGKKIAEVPIQFVERKVGASKISRAIVLEGIYAPWRILEKKIARRFSARRNQVLLAGALLALAAFFALFHLSESPSVWYDEGIYTQMGMNLAAHGISGFQLSPGSVEPISRVTAGYPLIAPLALTMQVFGTSILASRGLMVLFLLGFLLVAFAAMRREFGYGAAIGTLLLLATFPPLYGNGKSVLGEVPGLFFFALALLLLIRSEKAAHRSRWLFGAGIALGLSAATKPIFLIALAAFGAAALFALWRGEWSVQEVAPAALGAAASMGVWFLLQFSKGDSFAAILSFYANPYGATNLGATVLTNLKMFVTGLTPLYLLGMLFVWCLSFVIRYRKGVRVSVAECGALLTTVLMMLAYLRIEGWYRYLFPAQCIALLYFVPALVVVTKEVLSRVEGMLALAARLGFVLVIAFFATTGLYGLFFHSWVADSYQSDKTAFWEGYFASAPTDTLFFFYDVPEVARFAVDRSYYQFIAPAGGPFSMEELTAIEKGIPDTVIVRTDAWQREQGFFGAHYRASEERYKYSILTKRTP